jgi:hypothetical protein
MCMGMHFLQLGEFPSKWVAKSHRSRDVHMSRHSSEGCGLVPCDRVRWSCLIVGRMLKSWALRRLTVNGSPFNG